MRPRDPIDIAALMAQLRQDVLARTQHPATVQVRADSSAKLLGEEIQIHSALSNLVDNAAKYTPPEGSVQIRWWTDERGGHFCVTDTGIGIAPSHIPRLTERFYRGTRVVAAQPAVPVWDWPIAKHVLQRHGADLSIESEEGRGSKFTCDFPREWIQNLPALAVPVTGNVIHATKRCDAIRVRAPMVALYSEVFAYVRDECNVTSEAIMEAADISHHTSRRYNQELEQGPKQGAGDGGFVEDQLSRSLMALIDADSSLGRAVASDDYKVNGMELSIDDECSRILATRSPAAGDLRMVVATIKAITDLERIGDECEKVGLIAARLATVERPADRYREVKHLGRRVQMLVHDTLDAFARLDANGGPGNLPQGPHHRRGARGDSASAASLI